MPSKRGGRLAILHDCYTSQMKAAVSIPDDLLVETEKIARRQKRPRSDVVRDALLEYLARHDAESITQALNRIYDTDGMAPDSVIAQINAQALQQVEW